jgi:hypothetical protein
MARLRLAYIYDRMAAFVLDFTLVFFLHSYLSFAIKREQNLAMIEGYQTSFIFWVILNFLFFFFLYFFYHFIGFLKFKTTLGKFVFKIQLKNIWDLEDIKTSQAAKYSFWKTMSLLTLGLTYIGAFIDDKRRTLHEKLSDTLVVTKKQRYSLAPSDKEQQFFKGLLFPLHCLVAMAVIYVMVGIYQEAQKEILDAKLDTALQPTCDWIEQELKESGESSRMAFSISLFLLSEIDASCLEREARAAFEQGIELEEANMAFALLYPKERQAYLSEACNVSPGSFACYDSLDAKAQHLKPYQILWQARDAFKDEKYEVSQSLLNKIKNNYYQVRTGYLKFQNLWKLNPSEIQASISKFSDLIGQDTYDKVIAWACLDSTNTSCDSAPSFCSKILEKTDFSRAALEEELSYVRLRECKDEWSKDLPTQISEQAANLFYAKWRLKKHSDLRILRELMLDESVSYDVKQEIAKTMTRYGDLNTDDQQMLSEFQKPTDNRQPASE